MSRLLVCLTSALAFGIIAHAFGLFGSFYNHDSLKYVVSFEDDAWQVSIGRFLVPVYRALVLRGYTLPWVSGMLSMAYVGTSCAVATHLLQVRSKLLCVGLAGIVVTCISYTLLVATYLNQLDTEMFAVLLASFAALFWRRGSWGNLLSVVLLVACMGIYQAHISVCLVLIALTVIGDLACGVPATSSLRSALRGALIAITSGVLYGVLVRLSAGLWGVSLDTGSYNSVANVGSLPALGNLPQLLFNTWAVPIKFFLKPTVYNTVVTIAGTVAIALVSAYGAARILMRRNLPSANRVLMVVSACLLPILSNLAYALSGGTMTYLMAVAYFFGAYGLAVMGIQWAFPGLAISAPVGGKARHAAAPSESHRQLFPPLARTLGIITCGMFALIVIFQNTQYANIMYQKRDLEQRATLSLMTRVLYRMESTPGYVPGDTPVCFVREGGTFNFSNEVRHFEDYSGWMGTTNSRAVTYFPDTFQSYFDYVLNEPVNLVGAQKQAEIESLPEVASAPPYPDERGIRWVGDILVVKIR